MTSLPPHLLPHDDNSAYAGSGHLRLLGLDFGSTTSSMMLATARVGRHSVSGRMGLGDTTIGYQSDPVFTPFDGNRLNEDAVSALLDQWLTAVNWQVGNASTGAALITGLAARSDNAKALSRLIGERIGESLIVSTDDPRLESWLAFMGSCATLSRLHPQRPLINLDIGGGTTNPAVGRDGQVTDCSCFYIGARHLRFAPGTYHILGCSPFAAELLAHLRIGKTIGGTLTAAEAEQIVAFYVAALEAIVQQDHAFFQRSSCHRQLVQVADPVPLPPPNTPEDAPAIVTFSGGVGELVYGLHRQDDSAKQRHAITPFGDLGVDLALGILNSGILSADLDIQPEHAGRATVMGLTLHSSDISGSSLFLAEPERLPLRNLPIIRRLPVNAGLSEWQQTLALAAACRHGACLAIEQSESLTPTTLTTLAANIRHALSAVQFPAQQPLVLLMSSNLGKALGQYITDWGKEPRTLFVIDEIPLREARFVQIGRPHQHIVPVSFFGMH